MGAGVPVVLELTLVAEDLLRQFLNLHLVVGSVEQLPFGLLQLHSQQLDLVREPLNFYGLEDHDEVGVVPQVGLLVVGKVGNAGPASGEPYFLRSSP